MKEDKGYRHYIIGFVLGILVAPLFRGVILPWIQSLFK